MRMLPLLFVLPLCAVHAMAATPTPPPSPPAVQQAAPTPRAPVRHHRGGWEQRFAQANTSHDGHLTLAQAKGGYFTVARHFNQIDTGHKGYVTLDDIRAWHKQLREARHRRSARVNGALRPQPAFHRTLLQEPLNSGGSETQILPRVPSGASPPPKGVDPKAPS